MRNSKLSLSILKEKLAVCQLEANEQIPDWVKNGVFYSISITIDELSIVCLEKDVPDSIKSEKDWRAIKVEGKLDFSQTGILASIALSLAESGISIFAVSTFNTDYILVKSYNLIKAIEVLEKLFYIKS